jgi:hypothetical protein
MAEEVTEVAEDQAKPTSDSRAATAPKASSYRFIGNHAEILHDGRPVGVGDFVELTEEELRESHMEMLAHEGVLIGTDEASEHQVSLATRRVERRINNQDGEE